LDHGVLDLILKKASLNVFAWHWRNA